VTRCGSGEAICVEAGKNQENKRGSSGKQKRMIQNTDILTSVLGGAVGKSETTATGPPLMGFCCSHTRKWKSEHTLRPMTREGCG
jgi:hypothetical protein